MGVTRNMATETFLPNVGTMPYYDEGTANACGTTSLAMTMSYLGVPETKDQIDDVIRRMDIFTAPDDMLSFASSKGLRAQGYNSGLWENIETHIGLGQPCIPLIEAVYGYPGQTAINGLHYVVITGYGIDPTNNQRYAIFHDPNYTAADMVLYESQFVSMGNEVHWGFHDYYMAFSTFRNPLPPGNDNGIQGTLGALEGVTNITNGLKNIYDPTSVGSVVQGLFQIAGGFVGGIVAALGGLIQVVGQWLTGLVKGIPVLSNIVQPIGDLINGFGAVLGDLGHGVISVIVAIGVGLGDIVNDVVNGFKGAGKNLWGAFGSLVKGKFGAFFEGLGKSIVSLVTAVGNVLVDAVETVASAIADAATSVADAIGDAASAVGNAVSDFFSGW
jgi:Peptidase_C39 like family